MLKVWRNAGLSYIHFSLIAAKILRSVLKPQFQKDAMVRGQCRIVFRRWFNGKPEPILVGDSSKNEEGKRKDEKQLQQIKKSQ